ncbi:MTHFR-domain-containing protein [Alternaria alternata]|nr:MTHFR-domain-containing protein [Alternaria alternata]
MERITDKINALPDGANYFSLEFFPPKTAMVSCPACTRRMWKGRSMEGYRQLCTRD